MRQLTGGHNATAGKQGPTLHGAVAEARHDARRDGLDGQ